MSQSKTVRYFSFLQFLTYCTVGLWPYCLSYFRSLGLGSSEVGMISACGTFLCLIGLPLTGVLADKLRAARKILLITLLLLIPIQLILPMVGSYASNAFLVPTLLPLIAVLAAMTFFGERIAITMMDSWCGDAMDRLHLNYGTCRMFGCIGYILMAFGASMLLDSVLPVWFCFLIMAACSVPLILLMAGKKGKIHNVPREKDSIRPNTKQLFRSVFKNYYFLSYLFLVFGFYAYQAIVDLDLTYLMDHVGADHGSIGIIGGYRAFCELLVMIFLSRCKKLPPLWLLLTTCGFLTATEHLLYPSVSTLPELVALSTLTGIGGGLFFACNASYVFQIVDHRAASTAMSVQGVCLASTGIIGSMAAGSMIDRFGLIALTDSIGILILSATILFACFCVFGRIIRKKPYICDQKNYINLD